ncbi:MAG: hypothetical protein LBB98_12435 [Treponema sp.]|jgi:uncharacterized membrane-anchored protein|nr:hypothetical protein [Treponema sp.]
MIQFYFLSILFNALTGYILGIEQKEDEDSLEKGIKFSSRNGTFRLVLGVLTMVTGLLKILSASRGDIPVIGDIVPAIVGLVGGFVLIFEYYNSRSALNTEKSEKLARFLDHNKRWIGFIAIASAALHFLFPSVLFL